jgi:hypothetical protein
MRSFRNLHAGASVLVCGCGESLNLLASTAGCVTIGVNDVGRKLTPDYLVIVNPRSQFSAERLSAIEGTRARAVFSHLEDLRLQHTARVRFRLGRYAGTSVRADGDALDYTQNSPYVAVCLAMHLGASRIGLIGVDFTDDHFFGRTGRHALAGKVQQIDAEYAALAAAARAHGVELVNLSPVSRLTALPRQPLQEFIARSVLAVTSLKIVSYSRTPVAGVPEILARCISAKTPHRATCVWGTRDYGNGVRFEGGTAWLDSPQLANERLAEADVVIVHNGHVDPAHRRVIESKPTITMAHNYAWNVDRWLVERGHPGVVLGQYQATLPEFAEWPVVPNPLPCWESEFSPEEKGYPVRLCFTPSGAHEQYPAGHRLFWHAKGARTTWRVLDSMAQRFGCEIESTRTAQVSHAASLAMKRRSHIVIDECVTGSYHRNSLEGLAAGCVVINGVGLLPGVADALRRCAPGMEDIPFVFSDLASLERTLAELIERGAPTLAELGRASRRWLETNWDFEQQWRTLWQPVIEGALDHSPRPRLVTAHAHVADNLRAGPFAPARAEATPRLELVRRSQRRRGVSVVIPHTGAQRLPHLEASLKNLAGVAGVGEVIVAEMGDTPSALETSAVHGARYIWTHTNGPFERGRALNIGAGVALYERILWKDNDLLLSRSFVDTAQAEMSNRKLENLLPYTEIGYLGRDDTLGIFEGRRSADSCRPQKVLKGGRDVCGGAALVCADFLQRHGGIPEGFLGWGGEDNAWMHKAALLGRNGVTNRVDQKLFHLHHGDSGAQLGRPWDANPHYRNNVALLARLRSARGAHQFTRQFPNTGRDICPWSALKLVLVHDARCSELADAASKGLRELYGTEAIAVDAAAAQGAPVPDDAADRAVLVVTFEAGAAKIAAPGADAGTHFAVDLTDAHGPRETATLLAPALSVAVARSSASRALRAPAVTRTFVATPREPRIEPARPVRNVFACLVHESPECVIDLVRNLQCHDPTSTVLLYDGGNDPALLTKRFPFEKHGAIVCPAPEPMRWGYLHRFALDCMRFALGHLQFDTLTIVDSDQLATRAGYSAHLSAFLAGKQNVGMLSSARERQARSTRIAPAAQAWLEFDLWRPFLRRFPRGEEQFVHWTFWPGSVFTRHGAQALVEIFEDAQLQGILAQSRIWATEEIILPTLLAALGLTVEQNPCSGDYVKYRHAFSLRQLELALRRPDVFWVHPIARRYNDPLRTRLRRAAYHYTRTKPEGVGMNAPGDRATSPLLLTAPILRKMRPIEGWLDDEEADVLIAATARALGDLDESNAMVEIGSFCGRSTVVIASAIKALASSARLYAIDPHDGNVGALDEGIRNCGPTLEKLKANLQSAEVSDVVVIVPKASYDVEWQRPVSLLFIDGLHDYASVAWDFHHFEPWLVGGSYIAFHDYAPYYPGVMAFVDELLRQPGYRLVTVQKSLALVQRFESEARDRA